MRYKVKKLSVYTILFVGLFNSMIYSQDGQADYSKFDPGIFDHFGQNFINSYTGWPLLLHLTGIGLTYILVDTGTDADIQIYANNLDDTASTAFGIPGLLVGSFASVVIPGTMILFSDDIDTIRGGCAVAQSAIMSFSMNNLLKAITGRTPPFREYKGDIEKRSRDFQFGFLNAGVFPLDILWGKDFTG